MKTIGPATRALCAGRLRLLLSANPAWAQPAPMEGASAFPFFMVLSVAGTHPARQKQGLQLYWRQSG